MIDRIPANGKAGRMLITPENGQPSFYATVTMADDPVVPGTPLNKQSLMGASTERLFDFTEGNTVSDALAELFNCSVRDLRAFCVHYRGNNSHFNAPLDAASIYKWKVPTGIVGGKVLALILGGGGGGGKSFQLSSGNYNGGGGGGGGEMHLEMLPVSANEVLECKVGRGGRGAGVAGIPNAEEGIFSGISGKTGFYARGGKPGANATSTTGGKGGDGGTGGGGGYCWENTESSGAGGNASYGGGGGSLKTGGGGHGGTFGGSGAKTTSSTTVNGEYSGTPMTNFPSYIFGAIAPDCHCQRHSAYPGYGGSAGVGSFAGGGGFGCKGGTDTSNGGGGGGGFFGDGHDGVSTSGGGGGGYLDKYAYGGDGSGKTDVGQTGGDGLIMFIYAMSREVPTTPQKLV